MPKPHSQASQPAVVPDTSQHSKSQNIQPKPGKTGPRGGKKSHSGMRRCHVKYVYNISPLYI